MQVKQIVVGIFHQSGKTALELLIVVLSEYWLCLEVLLAVSIKNSDKLQDAYD